jgi:S1-C subfamily serine protease
MSDWQIPAELQPELDYFDFDLVQVLKSIAALRSEIPADAFSAETMGTKRQGQAVHIGQGQMLTIGYLINEAETIWLTFSNNKVLPATVLGYDPESGLALLQTLGQVDVPAITIGDADPLRIGDKVIVGGAGGRKGSLAAEITARQEFAGYWEYLLDDAVFTSPSHPNWGGTALIGSKGELLGIGSLQLEQNREDDEEQPINMFVPINLLKPIIEDLSKIGRANRPLRPWLGVHTAEIDGNLVVVGRARQGPARSGGLLRGDLIVGIAGTHVHDLGQFYRRLWSLGPAGVQVPLLIIRDGKKMDLKLTSGYRGQYMKSPPIH